MKEDLSLFILVFITTVTTACIQPHATRTLISPSAIIVSDISNDLRYVVESQRELGYHMPTILNAPASEEQMRKAEERFGADFNREIRSLYGTYNGVFNDYKTPSGLLGIIPIHELLSTESAMIRVRHMDWLEFAANYELQDHPGPHFWPITDDSAGDTYWVDLNVGSSRYGQVYYTTNMGYDPVYIFSSLWSFIHAIRIGYERKVFILDANGYLDCDYSEWREICQEQEPRMTYWQEQ